jgi:hypothetical protein
MKMILILVCLAFFSGCSAKDKDYYLDNLDEAKEKKQECSDQIFSALEAGDNQRVLEIRSNDECVAARLAVGREVMPFGRIK